METRHDLTPPEAETKFLFYLATLLFVLAELLALVAIFKGSAPVSAMDYLRRFGFPVVAAAPFASGMRGYSQIRKQLTQPGANESEINKLSQQFLYGVIVAYTALSFVQ